MTPRRGLTLVESLVAALLMATVVVACLPLLRSAAEQLGDRPETRPDRVPLFDLAYMADTFLTNPGAFGFAAVPETDAELPWPAAVTKALDGDAPRSRPAVHLRTLRADDPAVDRAWLVFECGGQCVSRWIAAEPLPAAPEPDGQPALPSGAAAAPAQSPPSTKRPRRARRPSARRTTIAPRGMTLIELLLALAILSMLLIAVATWTGTVARVAAAGKAQTEMDAPIEALFRLLADDLAVGDRFAKPVKAEAATPTGAAPPPVSANDQVTPAAGAEPTSALASVPMPRAEIVDDRLRIHTRSRDRGGPVVRDFVFERQSRGLLLRDRLPSGAFVARDLLDDVTVWECSIDERLKALTVTIALRDGAPLTRRYRLP